MHPPPGTEKAIETHILKRAIGQLAVPLVLHFCDLSSSLVIENIDLAVNGLFLVDTLDHISRTQIHGDGVAGGSDFMVQAFNFAECGLKTVPLWLELLAPFGFGDRILKYTVISPKLEFLKRGAACKKLDNGSNVSNCLWWGWEAVRLRRCR